MRAYSEVGLGPTMCLYLPRHAEDASPDEKAELWARAVATGDGKIVLVIDDEPTIRMLVDAARATGRMSKRAGRPLRPRYVLPLKGIHRFATREVAERKNLVPAPDAQFQ